jgi:erythromycin esterase
MDDVGQAALPLHRPQDFDPLLDRIGDARFVLLGEASHGTADYYHWRSALTRRLITELGFDFVAVEGDWPDCQKVDRAVRSQTPPVRQALDAFTRWPTWMWANTEVEAFAGWLRDLNSQRSPGDRVGFHGLDVYSLWDSLRSVLDYLTDNEPDLVETAARAFQCFEPYREDPQSYAWATRYLPDTCEQSVVDLLVQLCRTSDSDGADRFEAEQNAAVAAGAEEYYRAMVRGGPDSWNIRDVHMADTLDRLSAWYGDGSRAVVWEHNTHIGDARYTDMAADGMVNVGQLARERHGEDNVVLVGFAGYEGTVTAGDSWGAPARQMTVPPARPASLEARLHDAGLGPSLFVFTPDETPEWALHTLDHRAIGVVYRPERERWGNYVPTVTGRRYDALVYLPTTRALTPLHREAAPEGVELQAYPSGV